MARQVSVLSGARAVDSEQACGIPGPTRQVRARGSVQSTRWIEASFRAGAETELTLTGSSMAPALRDGDRLRVVPLAGAAPAPGEIVVARRGARLVTHRLVALV